MNAPSAAPANNSSNYPTARDLVTTAMAAEAANADDQGPDRFTYPCLDLDGHEHTLLLVPLGQRIAMVFPERGMAVLEEPAFLALDNELNDIFMAEAPEGLMTLGRVTGEMATSVTESKAAELVKFHDVTEPGSADVQTRAYATHTVLRLSSVNATTSLILDLASVQPWPKRSLTPNASCSVRWCPNDQEPKQQDCQRRRRTLR